MTAEEEALLCSCPDHMHPFSTTSTGLAGQWYAAFEESNSLPESSARRCEAVCLVGCLEHVACT